jgi:predicted dehydrogenase
MTGLDPVRLGVLSTARIADAIIGGAKEATAAEVVAVASRDRSRADEWAAARGLAHAFGSYEEMLACDEVEAVYVPLPNSMHLPWSVRALEAGKHVLCEKPLSRRAADVEDAFDAAEQAGRLLMEAFMWRYHPQTEKLVSLVREGAAGEVRLVRAAFGFPLPPGSNVRWSAELEGGALMDVGCYCVSALRLLAGEPSHVSAEAVVGGEDIDARMSGVLRFDGDVLGLFDCGFDVAKRSAIEVVGSEGSIVSADPWHGGSPDLRVLRDGSAERIQVAAANPYGLELDDFAQAVRAGAAPRLGRDDAVGQARVIEALYAAAEAGSAVRL